MSETPPTLRRVPPRVGEHTDEVIDDLLGEDRRRELQKAGALE